MWLLNGLIACCLAGCADVSCHPEFVINSWHSPSGMPAAKSGQLTVREHLSEIESVSFTTCNYND